MPVVVLRQVLRSMVQKTVESPQLQFIVGRRHSFRSAEADPHGPVCSADHGDFAVVAYLVVDVPVVPGRAGSQVLPWRRPWRFHSCSSLRNQTLSTTLRIWQSLVRRSPLECRILQDSGLHWTMSTSVYGGFRKNFIRLFDSGFLLMRQTTEAYTVHTAENCGVSAVAVH